MILTTNHHTLQMYHKLNSEHPSWHFLLQAKQVFELIGQSESTFGDMLSELGLAAAMRPKAEYTLLAPVDAAFGGTLLKWIPDAAVTFGGIWTCPLPFLTELLV